MKSNSKRILYGLQIFASLLGIGLSLYLLIQHTRITSGIQGSASFCTLGGFADCDVVNTSQFSEVAGIPVATFGAIFYFVLLLMSLFAPPKDKNFRAMQRAFAWLATAGLVVDLSLFLVQIISIKSVCLMCLGTYVASALALGSSLALAEDGWKSAFTYPKWPKLSGTVTAVCLIAIVSYVAGVFLIPYYIRSSAQTYSMVDNALVQFYQTWKDKPSRAIEFEPGEPSRGNPNARIKIVEFSDFQCPHCRRAAFTLHTALKPYEDKLFFVFKNYPLDSSCNRLLTYQLHPHACSLARLAICAQRKGKFWEYHDLVFLRMTDDDFRPEWNVVQEKLSPVFSKDEITQCLQDEKSLGAVTDSIKQGNALGVKGTPSVYIDGKLVTIPLTVETVRKLLDLEQNT